MADRVLCSEYHKISVGLSPSLKPLRKNPLPSLFLLAGFRSLWFKTEVSISLLANGQGLLSGPRCSLHLLPSGSSIFRSAMEHKPSSIKCLGVCLFVCFCFLFYFEGTFIKAGNSETRKDLYSIERAIGKAGLCCFGFLKRL